MSVPLLRRIVLGDNLRVLPTLPDRFARLIYIDPPFNTGRTQRRDRMKVRATDGGSPGDRRGFGGKSYDVERVESSDYHDDFDDFLGFLLPRIEASLRCLTDDGSLFVHLDAREVHYVKVALDRLLGRDHFINEIVWAYDYGARTTSRWPAKHDNILVYVKDRDRYHFDSTEVDREPYMAPGLVTPEKVARGKLPTDVWWHTIVSPTGKEKTGYPSQKPAAIVRRMVAASSRPGDCVLDFFAGSGTTGAVAVELGRDFVLVDDNPAAIDVVRARLGETSVTYETAATRT